MYVKVCIYVGMQVNMSEPEHTRAYIFTIAIIHEGRSKCYDWLTVSFFLRTSSARLFIKGPWQPTLSITLGNHLHPYKQEEFIQNIQHIMRLTPFKYVYAHIKKEMYTLKKKVGLTQALIFFKKRICQNQYVF